MTAIKGYQSRVDATKELEPELAALSDESAASASPLNSASSADGKTLDEILVPPSHRREAASAPRPGHVRVGVGRRHVLHEGDIAEMKTGEARRGGDSRGLLKALSGQGRARRHRATITCPARLRMDGQITLPRPQRRRDVHGLDDGRAQGAYSRESPTHQQESASTICATHEVPAGGHVQRGHATPSSTR